MTDFLGSVSEAATPSEDLLLRLREVCLPNVIAKKTVTNNPSVLLAIMQLRMEYGIPVRRGNGFPIIQGAVNAQFGDNQEMLPEAVQI
jgi:hypothetical protein